jgi:DNA-binding protein HU-beta
MNKAELTAAVATKLEVSKAEAGRIIETVLGEIIAGAVATGECVVPGLGKLEVKETAARSGVSKMGGVEKTWTKPAGKKISLKLSKEGKSVTESK